MQTLGLINKVYNQEVLPMIENMLKDVISKSNVMSKHLVGVPCIEVDIFDYKELVYFEGKLTFIDVNGYHYSLLADCEVNDLIDILSANVNKELDDTNYVIQAREFITGIAITDFLLDSDNIHSFVECVLEYVVVHKLTENEIRIYIDGLVTEIGSKF